MNAFPLTIETPRLVLRAAHIADAAQLHAAIRDSIESLRPWMTFAQTMPTIESIREKTSEWRALRERREYLSWRLFLKDADLLVGSVDLHKWDWSIPKCEIGYWGRTGYTGNGLVTEAVKAVVAVAAGSLGVKRIEALCDARNEASQRLALRAGFIREALLRDYELDVEGKLSDQVLFVWPLPIH